MFGLFLLAVLIFVAIFADQIAPYGVDEQKLVNRFVAPCAKFIFGTDDFGRDIFSRIVYGSRYSLAIGAIAATLSAVVGMLIGSIAGFYGGTPDNVLMRLIDVMMAIPSTLLGISIVAALGNGIRNVIIAVAIGAVPAYARIVRASILTVKEQEYIEAAHSIGASDLRIIMRHVLPNCSGTDYRADHHERCKSDPGGFRTELYRPGSSAPSAEWGAMLAAGRRIYARHGGS